MQDSLLLKLRLCLNCLEEVQIKSEITTLDTLTHIVSRITVL